MTRLTPEREKELREWAHKLLHHGERDNMEELFAEIDALRGLLEECRSTMQFALNYAEEQYREGDKGYQFAIYMREALECLRASRGEK